MSGNTVFNGSIMSHTTISGQEIGDTEQTVDERSMESPLSTCKRRRITYSNSPLIPRQFTMITTPVLRKFTGKTQTQKLNSNFNSNARQRWKFLQKHVRVADWLSKEMRQRHIRRFAIAQEALVDAFITSKDDFMELFVKIRAQFLTLLDTENCILHVDANSSILEFDGQSIYPSVRACNGLLSEAFLTGEHTHLPSCEKIDGINNMDIRSYLCIPLIERSGRKLAVVEIFNSRHDYKVIESWLSPSLPIGPLHVYCGFVGNLLNSFLHCAQFVSRNLNASHCKSVMPIVFREDLLSKNVDIGTASPIVQATELSLETLVDFLKDIIGVKHAIVYACDYNSNILWSRLTDSNMYSRTIKLGDGIVGNTAILKKPTKWSRNDNNKVETSMQHSGEEFHTNVKDILTIPTFDEKTALNGVVLLLNKQNNEPFSDSDTSIGVNICRYIGSVLSAMEIRDSIQKAQGKAQTLLDLSAVLFRELEIDSLLPAIVDAIKKPLNASYCEILLVNEDKTALFSPIEFSNSSEAKCSAIPLMGISRGIVGAAARSGEVVNVQDAQSDDCFDATVDHLRGSKFFIQSILAVPIKDSNGSVIGVLKVVNKLSKQYFDKDDEDLAIGIAYYVAISLNNARLFESARAAQRRSDALLAMMQVISSTNETASDVFESLITTACEILGVEYGTLFFVDSLSKTLFCRIGLDWKGYMVPEGKYLQGQVAVTGELINLVDATFHTNFDHDFENLIGIATKNLMCMPVKNGEGDVIAVFLVLNKIDKPNVIFPDEDIKIMQAICAELSSVIERRSWELVFQADQSRELNTTTGSFLSQYTTTPTVSIFDDAEENDNSIMLFSGNLDSKDSRKSSGSNDSKHAPFQLINLDKNICDWDVDPWNHSTTKLLDMVVDMFNYFNLLKRYEIPIATMRRFAVSVKSQYQDIPYHNFYHAFSTLHMCFQIVRAQMEIGSQNLTAASQIVLESAIVRPKRRRSSTSTLPSRRSSSQLLACFKRTLFGTPELMAILIGAYCHDMNHNGRTNDFHIQYRTSIAMLYNDQSVLENMHAAACFETMRRPGHDLLANATKKEYQRIRKMIISAILATDMQNHASMVTQMHEKLKPEVFTVDDESHKCLLLNAIVHAADISSPTLNEKLHMCWSHKILEEFNMQYEEEKALDMEPTPYMNAQPGSVQLGKMNLAFIDSCVFPLWSALDKFLDGLGGCLDNIQKNRQIWLKLMEQDDSVAHSGSVELR